MVVPYLVRYLSVIPDLVQYQSDWVGTSTFLAYLLAVVNLGEYAVLANLNSFRCLLYALRDSPIIISHC